MLGPLTGDSITPYSVSRPANQSINQSINEYLFAVSKDCTADKHYNSQDGQAVTRRWNLAI